MTARACLAAVTWDKLHESTLHSNYVLYKNVNKYTNVTSKINLERLQKGVSKFVNIITTFPLINLKEIVLVLLYDCPIIFLLKQ